LLLALSSLRKRRKQGKGVNRVEEGKARIGKGGCDEEVASSKKTELKTRVQKFDTQFMTKTAEKPYPLGPHIPI